MTRCRTAILSLILSLALLLCGCQAGGGVFLLPESPSDDTAQAAQTRAQLLEAMNSVYQTNYVSGEAGHFTYGNDSNAEAVLAYLQEACAGDAAQVAALLSESGSDISPVRCADTLLMRVPSLAGTVCRVSYAKSASGLSSTAEALLRNQAFLVLPPAEDTSDITCDRVGFAFGTIGGQAFVIAVFTA